jgi:hypothetical protein
LASTAVDQSLAALNTLTAHVIKEGSEESLALLGKLYGELQKKVQSTAPLLLLALTLAVCGCGSPSDERNGWAPPTAEERHELYGDDAGESLKAQAPQLFGESP